MLESKNPEIDLTQLLEKIGLELKLQQKRAAGGPEPAVSEELEINDPYSWGQLSSTLNIAEQNVNAGAEVTTMLHYRGIVRKFAKLLGKITIFLGRVITIPQRNFNSSILHSQRITLDGIRDMNRNTALLDRRMRQIEGQLKEKSALIDYLKTGLVTQERRVSILLEELRRQLTAGEGKEDFAVNLAVPDILDPLYLAFENQFRGTREEIRERLLEYVPLIRGASAGSADREILDIGCGRGEWLEILKDEGLAARGLDLNHVLVQECREKGFEVVEKDALSHLRSLPDNSLGAITAFHVIEHLGFDDRIALFDESVRVLKPGGVAFFETPNPRNLLVGGCNFWADPTHLRPLYPETQQFLMEYRGFCKVDLLFLHPHEGEQRLPEEEAPQLASRLNEVFSCARDYTVVGYKV
ncbi:MAG: class I SAM-dependent methyltransferase [Proteobacteria bacterium]|nr:class I SAM-dependent methyltransferase [Pseudomonadota bacterium]MBU1140454.1 class I SAM-dependent methyltransferase [Pseudomonadota bacterium]MBU1232637.1 class I SAM-dependent methyltransferase [Pseudomonadota bacterium]MBU1417935.1 class I SAM-dependent methyltransferase [Pseudomonadota bacterium]MBU1456637.1 class I SAM-dependent methyltransferase [Pseudomonadota bacterium]